MPVANMDNKLAILWRENVMKLMQHFDMRATDLSRFTDRSHSTLQSCFGGTVMKSQASQTTMAQLEKGFKLKKGALSSPNFNPAVSVPDLPAPVGEPPPQLASINIPIPADKLEKIMRILLDD